MSYPRIVPQGTLPIPNVDATGADGCYSLVWENTFPGRLELETARACALAAYTALQRVEVSGGGRDLDLACGHAVRLAAMLLQATDDGGEE